MAGRVHLGTEGEAAAADVLAAWEVGSGFECCAVVSEYPAALAELKARLQEKSERLYTLKPDARFREDGLHALAAKLATAKTRAVVWLEQDPFDEAGWRSALSALNQDRSWLRSQCPAFSFGLDFVRYCGIDSAHYEYARRFGFSFACSFTMSSPIRFDHGLPVPWARGRFFHCFSSESARGFVAGLAYDTVFGMDPEDHAQNRLKAHQFRKRITAGIDVELGPRPLPPTSPRSTAPARQRPAPWEPWLAEVRDLTADEQAPKVLQRVMAALGGEMIIALAAMAEGSVGDGRSYFLFRPQNRWLCEIWPALDDYLPTPPGPWQLAIYYALAWTQFSTTWTWPETERWRALFDERPPAHWLPRTHWHLCWLSYDPGLTDHLQGLDEALAEGEADTVLPGYAAAFREILGRPGGSKGAQG